MNQALFLISLQHELSMSMGAELQLEEMLSTFLKVCLKRVHLSSCHIYLHHNEHNMPIKVDDKTLHKVDHFISIPKRFNGNLWQKNNQLKQFINVLNRNINKIYIQKKIQNEYFHAFKLPEHGFLIWHSQYPLIFDVKKAIIPMLSKLSRNCYSCIVHDELSYALKAKQDAEDTIAHQAIHDGLTNLYNREYINSVINNMFVSSSQTKTLNGIIFIDLNKFKSINDTMGHAVGDQILITVAKRLRSLTNQHIKAARFGGDEFIIVMSDLSSDKNIAIKTVEECVHAINQRFKKSILVDTSTYNIALSLGYCLFPDIAKTTFDAVTFSDIAMYEAKRTKISTGLAYKPEMSERLFLKEAYVREIKHGLLHNEFMLHYQPQYNDKHQIIGAEALLRWNNPKREYVSPEVYIPIAEESNLIIEIGNWVIEQACKDIQTIEQLPIIDTFENIAINVSPKQLIDKNFSKNLLSQVNAKDILPKHLNIEITEGLLIESFQETIDTMLSLQGFGIDCSLDDFGTGYSSLTYLKRIPATLIKIDRSFVTNIHLESENTAIADMIITLGKSLKKGVLAEGVETEEELDCLKGLGCKKYQGYYFNKPMPFNEFLDLLIKQ